MPLTRNIHVITSAGKRIVGRLFLPEGKGPFPVIIISHGFCSGYNYASRYAKNLVKHGYACYAYDFCGGAPRSHSSGSFSDMSVLTETEDLKLVLSSLREEPWADPARFFLLGESQGGLVSALVGADLQDTIRGLVLFFPAFVIPDDARGRFAPGEEITESSVMGIPVGKKYTEDVYDMDVWAEICAYTGPVFLIHGTADRIVPIRYSRRAKDVYANVELLEIPGAGHGFSGRALEQACEGTAAFLNCIAMK